MTRALNPKQERFAQEYLVDLNATAAAKRAGYSDKTAGSQGHDLLKKPEIQDAITKAQAARSERTGVNQDRVLEELARIGFSDLRKILTPGGNLIDLQDIDDDTAAAIASVEIVVKSGDDGDTAERVQKIRLWDKTNALEKIARHLGMFNKDKVAFDLSDEAREFMALIDGKRG